MPNDGHRVIEILDEYSILVNYGRDHGAEEGDEIRVIATGPEVIDPVTNEVLGTLDSVKATLTIAVAYRKFSLCKKIETITKNVLISPISQFQTTTKTIKPIEVDEKSITNKKAPDDKIIKIGDKIEII